MSCFSIAGVKSIGSRWPVEPTNRQESRIAQIENFQGSRTFRKVLNGLLEGRSAAKRSLFFLEDILHLGGIEDEFTVAYQHLHGARPRRTDKPQEAIATHLDLGRQIA